MTKDITSLGQKHYVEEVFYTYNTWNYHPSATVLPPNLRLLKEDCDLSPDPVFHSRSRDIVDSLDYLVNMTRSYLVFDLISLLCIPNSANMFNSRSNSMWPPLTTCFGIFTVRMKRAFSSVVVSNTSISSGVGLMPIRPLTPELHRYPPISYRFCPHVQWWINQLQVPSTGFRHFFNFGDWTHDCHRGRERGRVHLHSVLSDTILQDFGFTPKGPTNLYEDNLACVVLSINPVRRKYSRHIDIHRHCVRELALVDPIKFFPLGTRDIVTDVLTKIFPAPALIRHSEVMMGHQRLQSFYPHSLCAS